MPSSDVPDHKHRITRVQQDKKLAMVAQLGGIFFFFFPALIIYLVKKDDRSALYVRNQAREALNFQINVTIALLACYMLLTGTVGLYVFLLIWITNVFLCIHAAIKTSNGDNYRYPLSLRFVH